MEIYYLPTTDLPVSRFWSFVSRQQRSSSDEEPETNNEKP
jgi:hypothetical protein